MRGVAVVGTGQTQHASRRRDVSVRGLVREAVDQAVADAGMDLADVDAVVLGTAPDVFEGIAQPEHWLAGVVGAVGKPLLRVHTAGSVGGSTAVAAAAHVASGLFDRVLAVAFEKLSESDPLAGLSPRTDAGRLFGAGAGAFFAPYIRRYRQETGAPDEVGPQVAVKARAAGSRNRYAHLREPVSLDEVYASPMLWDPLRRLECCPTSDGAAAVVFASAPVARGRRDVAWVLGAAAMAEAQGFPDRDGVDPVVGSTCAATVYRQAGIRDPGRDLDVVELYEPFSWIEPMWYENLGLCPQGVGWEWLLEGVTGPDGALPVNPSGGVLCANPIGATGLVRVIEAADQVRGRCDAHQVDGARTAVAHAYGGSSNYVAMMVLGAAPQ